MRSSLRLFGVLQLLLTFSVFAEEPEERPFELSMPPDPLARKVHIARPDSVIASRDANFSFYQRYISPVRGGRCPMKPSCSVYCSHAIDRHGPLLGFTLACERLTRCGRDLKFYSLTVNYKGLAYEDPVP